MDETKPAVTRPYEVIAYAALAIVAVFQLIDGNAMGAMLSLGCGVLAMFAKMQMGPIFYLVLSSGAMIAFHNQGLAARTNFRPAFLDVNDTITCIGMLAFVAAHYRLQGIWYSHLTPDPRRSRRRPAKAPRQTEEVNPARRPAENVGQAEVSWLIFSLPIWALAAQFLTHWIPVVRIGGFEAWLIRMMLVFWALAVATFVVGNLLDVWKRYTMSPAAAWMFLQDTLWKETRGEQRQMQRWLAWKRLRRLRK